MEHKKKNVLAKDRVISHLPFHISQYTTYNVHVHMYMLRHVTVLYVYIYYIVSQGCYLVRQVEQV